MLGRKFMESNHLKTDIYYHYINNRSNDDLFVLAFGHEKCRGSKDSVGPMKKSHFLVHYVISGEGTFTTNNKTYTLTNNDSFVIYPNYEFCYKQNTDNPWEYIWIEFNGSKAKNYCSKALFSMDTPTHRCNDENIAASLKDMLKCPDNEVSLELNSLSHLYKLFAQLINERNPQIGIDSSKRDIHISLALKYIENHYSNSDLCLKEIGNSLCINPSYLSRIFKEIMGTPISKYIIDLRMQRAADLLVKNTYAIKNVAYMVGYADPHFFSNEFKKHMGTSPKKYEAEGKYNESDNADIPLS